MRKITLKRDSVKAFWAKVDQSENTHDSYLDNIEIPWRGSIRHNGIPMLPREAFVEAETLECSLVLNRLEELPKKFYLPDESYLLIVKILIPVFQDRAKEVAKNLLKNANSKT